MVLRLTGGNDPDRDSEEKRAELTEHLAELRTRLIRSCVYVIVGMILLYAAYDPVYRFLTAPIDSIMKEAATKGRTAGLPPFVYRSFLEPFMLKLQISTVGGLILAMPAVIVELWGFVKPALTPAEKNGVAFVAPMSITLFIMGLSLAYLILPMAIHWFLSFLPPDAILLQNPLDYVVFVIKLLLVFGLLFQLPVALMFLGKVGIITSAMMLQYWRQIAVGLFTLAMVVAPSNDPGTMLALAIPLTILFFGSIFLVKFVEPKPENS